MRLLVVGGESRRDELSKIFGSANLTITTCPGIRQAVNHYRISIADYDWIILNRLPQPVDELELLYEKGYLSSQIPLAFLSSGKNEGPLLSFVCSAQRSPLGTELLLCHLAKSDSLVVELDRSYNGETLVEYHAPCRRKPSQKKILRVFRHTSSEDVAALGQETRGKIHIE
jgi:hypothetical protein